MAQKMSKEHKEALAEGRRQGKAVREYLEALESQKRTRGRPRTKESILGRINQIDESLDGASAVDRLQLVQERLDLADELSAINNATSLDDLEEAFVENAAAYGERKGIQYKAWREVGVPAAVLKRAGITRAQTDR